MVTPRRLADLRIVRYGHPALRQPAQRVGRVSAKLGELAERMAELMEEASGLGLAANQVGIPRRLAVVKVEGEIAVLVDPQITSAEGTETVVEGCLSLPRLYADVHRPSRVVMRARDLSGKRFELVAEGLLARAICHEIDHLDGKLFIDRAEESTLHWLVGATDEGEQLTQPTTLEEALKVFTASLPPPSRGARR